jgi:hypothetical protein
LCYVISFAAAIQNGGNIRIKHFPSSQKPGRQPSAINKEEEEEDERFIGWQS